MIGGSETFADLIVIFPREVGATKVPMIEAYCWPSVGWSLSRLERFPTKPAAEMYCTQCIMLDMSECENRFRVNKLLLRANHLEIQIAHPPFPLKSSTYDSLVSSPRPGNRSKGLTLGYLGHPMP